MNVPASRCQKLVRIAGLIALATAGSAIGLAAEAPSAVSSMELPQFKPGMWEYRRTQLTMGHSKPQTRTVRKCADPTSDIKSKLAELEQRGCRFRPPAHEGNQYRMSWLCPSDNDRTVTFHDVLTVRSAESYQDSSEAHQESQVVHTELIATRTGDCPGPHVRE